MKADHQHQEVQSRTIKPQTQRHPQGVYMVDNRNTSQMKLMDMIQRMGMEEEELQMKHVTQLQPDDEELQMKPVSQLHSEGNELLSCKFETTQQKPNNTGLSDNLKSGIESMSGFSMNDVRVHYNSDKPAQLQAHAYAQGTDIHIAPGQEKHLPHEAWHVAQQKQGRVQPTMQMHGLNVNDNTSLEREANVMGDMAVKMQKNDNALLNYSTGSEGVIQGHFTNLAIAGDILSGYQRAANYWTNANTRIQAFIQTYQNDNQFTNSTMEDRMLTKAIKASTTLAGESFETFGWQQNAQGTYIGPSNAWRGVIDLVLYNNVATGIATPAPQYNGEVKSSTNANWRTLFNWIAPGLDYIAYLSDAALINAQASPGGQNSQQQAALTVRHYIVYDKDNPGNQPFVCN